MSSSFTYKFILKKEYSMNKILLVFLFIIGTVLCSSEKDNFNTNKKTILPPDKDKLNSKKSVVLPKTDEKEIVSIKSIVTNSSFYKGKSVLVLGVYSGWKGKCNPKSSVTRNDWMLESEGECIYVTGKNPPGLSANKPEPKEILVKGIIELKDGVPYIIAEQLELKKETKVIPKR